MDKPVKERDLNSSWFLWDSRTVCVPTPKPKKANESNNENHKSWAERATAMQGLEHDLEKLLRLFLKYENDKI